MSCTKRESEFSQIYLNNKPTMKNSRSCHLINTTILIIKLTCVLGTRHRLQILLHTVKRLRLFRTAFQINCFMMKLIVDLHGLPYSWSILQRWCRCQTFRSKPGSWRSREASCRSQPPPRPAWWPWQQRNDYFSSSETFTYILNSLNEIAAMASFILTSHFLPHNFQHEEKLSGCREVLSIYSKHLQLSTEKIHTDKMLLTQIINTWNILVSTATEFFFMPKVVRKEVITCE